MLKINQKNKKESDYFSNLLIMIFLILFNRSYMVYGANNNRVSINKNKGEIEYLDKNSINYKDKVLIEITTRYKKIDTNTSKEIEKDIFIKRLNYFGNKYKGISVNDKKNLSLKWKNKIGKT